MAEPAVAELGRQNPDIGIRWRSFELRPEPVPTLDPAGDYLVDAWRHHVYPLAARMQMPLKRPPIQPRSRLAHEAAKWAEAQGQFETMSQAIFQAFFQFGADIGEIAVLTGLAAERGLDPLALDAALRNNAYTAAVRADEDEAARVGVRAVPAFVASNQVLAAGVQSSQRLHELLCRISQNID